MPISNVTASTVIDPTAFGNAVVDKLNNIPDEVTTGTTTGTTDASGSLTVTHGLGYTPSAVILAPQLPNGGTTATRFVSYSLGTLGATTFVVNRCVSQDGTLLASTSVTFRWVAFK